MTPERKVKIGSFKVEEFYWNGKYVSYIDNKKFNGTFEEAIDHAELKQACRDFIN